MSIDISFRNAAGQFVSHNTVLSAIAVQVVKTVAIAFMAKGAAHLANWAIDRAKAKAQAQAQAEQKAA